MVSMLAEVVGGGRAADPGGILIWIVIIAAAVGIALIALRVFGLVPPPWVWQILGIVACAVVAILAIRFVLSL
jgi:hypothetical protein